MADECFSGVLIRAMTAAGFDIVRSAVTHPSAPDHEVLALAFAAGRILMTEDNDFGDLVVRFGLPTLGVIRVDLKLLDSAAQSKRIVQALSDLGSRVEGAMVTIEPTRARLRPIVRAP